MSAIIKSLVGDEFLCELQGLEGTATVDDVKRKIAALTGIPVAQMKVRIKGKYHRDDKAISACRWKPGGLMQLAVADGTDVKQKPAQVAKSPMMIPITFAPAVPTLPQYGYPQMDNRSQANSGYFRGDEPMYVLVNADAKPQAPTPPPTTPIPETSDFGYYQIDNYAQKHHRMKHSRIEPGPKRWVSLPSGLKVHSFDELQEMAVTEVSSSTLKAQPTCVDNSLRSCIEKSSSLRSSKDKDPFLREISNFSQQSTSFGGSSNQSGLSANSQGSQGDMVRLVRFIDGLAPGDGLCEDTFTSAATVPLAEWIYLDRDTCGVSLYNYAPESVEHQEFTSSPFAASFRKEFAEVCRQNRNEQNELKKTKAYLVAYYMEEQVLHKALRTAGVRDESSLTSEIELAPKAVL